MNKAFQVKHVALCAMLIILGASGAGPSLAEAQGESNVTADADEAFTKADNELNVVYRKMLQTIVRSDTRANFIKAQRAWITFRDAEAEFRASSGARGGIAYAVDYTDERTKLSKDRIQQLQRHQQEYPNWDQPAP